MKTLGRITALVVVAVVFSACGSEGGDASLTVGAPAGVTTAPANTTIPGTAPPGPVTAACQALSTDEIASALGNAVRSPTGEGKNCFWNTAVDRGTSIYLTVTKPARPQDCAVQRDALPKELPRQDVSGVGTSAVWVSQKLSVLLQGTFLACWADAVVILGITGEKEEAALRTTARNLAERVHERL